MPLTLLPQPTTREGRLTRRLDDVTAAFRRVALFRGGSFVFAVAAVYLFIFAWLDHRFQLPPLVRAIGLTGFIVGLILLFNRYVRRPWRSVRDPHGVALRVERHFPDLKDSFASALAFLDDPDSGNAFKQATLRRALKRTEHYDLTRAVESRYLKRAMLTALLVLCGVLFVAIRTPAATRLALKRFAFPFAGHVAPTSTKLTLLTPSDFPVRLAKGDPFDLVIQVEGVLPDRATVSVRFEAGGITDQSYALPLAEESSDVIVATLRIEPSRIAKSFDFRVRTNDAATEWHSVLVLPPPLLIPIDGRPSPQLHVDFPAYTGLPPQSLSDGGTIVEGVAGTRVRLRAAVDRPVQKAFVVYRPEQPKFRLVPPLAALGGTNLVSAIGTLMLADEAVAELPLAISTDGLRIEGTFVPRLPGAYAFRFEDETGLGGTRLLDVRVFPDPVPLVLLERPSQGRDSLNFLPEAEVPVAIKVLDPQYAIRNVHLEYRIGREGIAKRIPLHDSQTLGRVLPQIARWMGPVPVPQTTPSIRPPQLVLESTFSLAALKHPDGKPLQSGDIVVLQAVADDFDDVTLFKSPGRSPEVELVIASKDDLEVERDQTQSELRNELQRLLALQKEARKQVAEAADQMRQQGKLRPEDLDKLSRAEQTQQQIRERLNNPEDGLLKQLERLQQSAKNNKLPESATSERLNESAGELRRLNRDVLDPLDQDLAAGRRSPDKAEKADTKSPLAKAEQRQKEIEDSFKMLLDKLEPWSGAGELRGQARSLQGELKRTIEEREKEKPAAKAAKAEDDPNALPPEKKAELEKAAAADDRLAEKARQMVEKLNRMAVEKETAANQKREFADKAGSGAEANAMRDAADQLSQEADALRRAAMESDVERLKSALRDAAQNTRENQTGEALAKQKTAAGQLDKLIRTLDQQEQDQADRMAKKNREAGKQLDSITDRQDLLQKKVEEAMKIADPQERQKELDRLAREQDGLRKEAQELADKLTRNRSTDAAKQVEQAAREMAAAKEAMENGGESLERQDDALDKLDTARAELDQQQKRNEEALEREKNAQAGEEIKNLRDRQLRAIEEAARLHSAVKKDKKWDRPRRASLNDLRRQQQALAEDVRALIEKKYQESAVYGRMLRQSADAMDLAARRMANRLDAAEIADFDPETEEIADTGIRSQQGLALKRLDQLLEATKPEPKPKEAGAPNPPKEEPKGEPKKEGDPMPKEAPKGPKTPPLAQLKALRSLQADISERTEAFDKAHPDRTKLNDDEADELTGLEQMQRDVAELIKSLTQELGGGGLLP